MVLQALNRYYDILMNDPYINIPGFGYSSANISFVLNISAQGELLDVFPLLEEATRGKKIVEVPVSMVVPQQVKRASNVIPNFLWDNSTYVLGISDKDEVKPDYSRERQIAFCEHNQNLLKDLNSDVAQAIFAFLENYDPQNGREHPEVKKYLEDLKKGSNLVFSYKGRYAHEDSQIRMAWESYLSEQGGEKMQCLVSGEMVPIARLHPNLKRVRGAQSAGATLVGFNAPAYESYNRSQGANSPVGEKAVFAYTTILNYLLSDQNPNKKFFLGDTTIIYWAESGNRVCESMFSGIFDPEYKEEQDSDDQTARRKTVSGLKSVTEKVRRVQQLDVNRMLQDLGDENPQFYILGLAPNAARISVRFFIADPFLKIVGNIMEHYQNLEIEKEFDSQPDYITLGNLLSETVSKKSRDKNASPLLAGSVFRSILTGTPYPAGLYSAVITRIRADVDDSSKNIKKINYTRAAIIKAYLIRKFKYFSENPFKEVLIMSLNEQSTIPAYVLGRLFAVLEKVQQDAIGTMNASIKDRYFTSACATPSSVFPVLLRLSQHHISKAEYGRNSDRKIQEILNLLDIDKNPIPSRLSLDEQGLFVLGYYHQRVDIFKPKKNVSSVFDQNEIE